MVARFGSPRSPPLAGAGRSSIESSRPVRARMFPRLRFLMVRCARCRFVVAIAPARRPCPLPPPPRPPSPPLACRSLSGGGCNAPSLFLAPLRSGGGAWLCAPAPPRAIPRLSVAQGRPAPPPSLRCAIPPTKRSLLGWPLRARPRLSSRMHALKISALKNLFAPLLEMTYLCTLKTVSRAHNARTPPEKTLFINLTSQNHGKILWW